MTGLSPVWIAEPTPMSVAADPGIHATCIAFDGKGVLLRGPPGSGKSDLALRAMADGARLIADDHVVLVRDGSRLFASAPASLHGRIEIRGLGIFEVEADRRAELAMIVDLVDPATIERLPAAKRIALAGIELPRFALAPFEASAVAKLRFALMAALDPGIVQS
jgi:serine kinase of HPr protein (carbohydrate metabolism regulator)